MDQIGINQETLSDSKIILDRIKYELLNAKQEVLIAMAWFTDFELFDILLNRVQDNVAVSIILSDQPDNEKLDFALLTQGGAHVTKIKNVGWGMMHQKFCVIDRKVAITGSYNWSRNAKNNHESVIITNFQKTVSQLVETFFKIKNRAIRIANGEPIEEIENEESTVIQAVPEAKVPENQKMSFQEQSLKDFKGVLDSIIATEIGSFDKNLLKSSGYLRAEENNGDHQILHQAMDSLYSNFINEIEVIDDKKARLKARIDEQVKVSIANVELKTENEINTSKENIVFETRNTESNINALDKEIDQKKLQISSNKQTVIPFIENNITSVRQRINELNVAFVKPPINWPLTVVLSFMTILLASYIFVFYSSVAYIFIFSKEDILDMLSIGSPITETPEVFNAHALSKIWGKGTGGIMFLFLFVTIPLALGMYNVLMAPISQISLDPKAVAESRSKIKVFFNKNLGLMLILLIDIFIAYKVAMNINEVEYLTRVTDHKLKAFEVTEDSNFWLVFILGSLGIYLFGLVFEKLFAVFNQRHKTFQEEKIRHQVGNYEEDIQAYLDEINRIKLENDLLSVDISNLEKDRVEQNKVLQNSPINSNEKISFLKQQLLSFREKVGNLAHIYQSQIDNDKLPISKAEMENRVNIFMEGWSKYLYEVYSVQKAESKTKEAINEIEYWLKLLPIQTEFKDELNQTHIPVH